MCLMKHLIVPVSSILRRKIRAAIHPSYPEAVKTRRPCHGSCQKAPKADFRGRGCIWRPPTERAGWLAGLAGLAGWLGWLAGWLGLQRGRLQRAERFPALRPRPASCGAAANEFIPPSVGGIEWLRPLLFKRERITAGAEHSRAVGATRAVMAWQCSPNMLF